MFVDVDTNVVFVMIFFFFYRMLFIINKLYMHIIRLFFILFYLNSRALLIFNQKLPWCDWIGEFFLRS